MVSSLAAPAPSGSSPARRRFRSAVLARSLAAGAPVRASTVDLVLAAGYELTSAPPWTWDADQLAALTWYGVLASCRAAGRAVPDDAAVALRWIAETADAVGPNGPNGAPPRR